MPLPPSGTGVHCPAGVFGDVRILNGRSGAGAMTRGYCFVDRPYSPQGGGGAGTMPWWLALLACGGAYGPLAFEPSAMTSRHPYYCGHPPASGGHPEMQFLSMASSPDGLISARYAVITKTPGWGVLTTTSNVNVTQGHGC